MLLVIRIPLLAIFESLEVTDHSVPVCDALNNFMDDLNNKPTGDTRLNTLEDKK